MNKMEIFQKTSDCVLNMFKSGVISYEEALELIQQGEKEARANALAFPLDENYGG